MEILLKPVLTEKMTLLGEKLNRYGFIVNKDANKIQIKKAVEEYYEVTVKSVNTMVYPGKTKTKQTKTGMVSGKTSSYKKAVVTLVDGDTINFFSKV